MSTPAKLTMRPVRGEAVLRDPAVTGQFAPEMARLADQKQTPPWCGFLCWSDDTPLGFAGFKGPPDADGMVEIGYLTFPGNEGKGVASAMAASLVHLARSAGARTVTAQTLPEDNPSTSVLRRNGFVRDGIAIDDDEGEVWRWALPL